MLLLEISSVHFCFVVLRQCPTVSFPTDQHTIITSFTSGTGTTAILIHTTFHSDSWWAARTTGDSGYDFRAKVMRHNTVLLASNTIALIDY